MPKIALFILILALSGMVWGQNTPVSNTVVQGSITATNNQAVHEVAIQIMDIRHERVLLQIKTDTHGVFSCSLPQGRYNLYVNGEFVQIFFVTQESVSLRVTVEPYILQMPAPESLFISFSTPTLVAIAGVAAMGGVAAIPLVIYENRGDSPKRPLSP